MPVTNAELASLFREVGDLLEIQEANPFRVRAYRTAARTIEAHPEPVGELVLQDPALVDALPGIGEDLTGKIGEIARTGRLTLLNQLRRRVPKGVREMMSVPGVGPRKATRLHDVLGLRGLADLGRAARAGRLRTIKGFT